MDLPEFSLDLSTLGDGKKPNESKIYDILILGGGPAAMTAAVYGARKLMSLALISKELGGQMTWTSEIENYMGFQAISGDDLARKFKEQVQLFDVPILKGRKVVKVTKSDDGAFSSTLDDGSAYRSKTVIFATGKRSRRLGVPGEDELSGKGVTYCATCDAPFYKDKRVVIAGGGDSAATAAQDLLKIAAKIDLVNFAEGWQADEILMQPLVRSDKVDLHDAHEIVEIVGQERVSGVRIRDRRSDDEKEIPAEGVFVEIGLFPNSGPLEGLVEMTANREVIIDCWARTSMEGLFAAGDVTTVPYKQIVVSAGEGAKAALSAYGYLLSRGEL
jgi:alkyl hydroperoxide reductase subunit F